MADRQIELTEVEKTLRQLLLDVGDYIDSSSTPPHEQGQAQPPPSLQDEKIVLRFTGGWVRDKLLGVDSHDIDVAINKMTGFQFGLKMKEFIEKPGNAERYGIDAPGIAKGMGLHKIEANPEKSKHLETVTTKILGLDIDLVNLRKETYTEQSRNPQMEFGTPEEDALRRDATVNAMFYNLNTGQVEDFTGRGHEDMAARLIRTPLEPHQTFKDDPLRVLRLIRFATRLGYEIDPTAQEAMRADDIKTALRVKISRERVGIELDKMLRGKDPRRALAYLDELGLYTTIFTDPASKMDPENGADTSNWSAVYEYLGSRGGVGQQENETDTSTLYEILLPNQDAWYQAWVSACLVPWFDTPDPPAPKENKRPIPWAIAVAREGFRATNKVTGVIDLSIQHRKDIIEVKERSNEQTRFPHKRKQEPDATARDTLGMAIRRWGASWRQQVVFAMLTEILEKPDQADEIERNYASWLGQVKLQGVLDAYQVKPIIDGKALSAALKTPPGPWMKDALDVVVAWQLRNPDSADSAEAVEMVKARLWTLDSDSKRRSIDADKANAKGLPDADMAKAELVSLLASHILREVVRPLFSKTKTNPSLTPAGRRRDDPLLSDPTLPSEDDETKPWKHSQFAIPLFRWTLSALTPTSAESNWPLLIPPVLAMVDDHEVRFKSQGCNLLRLLLTATPPVLLKRTGLAGVFEEALMPCLSYLPTLTPVDESVEILDAAYPALLALANAQFPVQNHAQDPELWESKVGFVDKLIRHGILHGMAFAGENVRVAQVLVRQLAVLVREEGVDSVKHLKQTVPLLSDILAEPFALSHVPLLLVALETLREVVRNGWMRISRWKGEVLKGICLLWVRMEEEGKDSEDAEELRGEMRACVELLDAAVERAEGKGLSEDVAVLTEADEKLKGLFGSVAAV